VPPSRRDPLNDRTSPQPFRAANIHAIRSTTTRHRHVHHLRAAAFAVRYRQRRAPSQRDTHRQGTAAHVIARRRQLPRGRRFKAPRVRQTSFPSGTAGVRRLPLAAIAAREAQLHVVPTAQPRASRQYTLQTAVDRAAAWSCHSRNLQLKHWTLHLIHAGILENILQLTLEHVYQSLWKISVHHKEEIICKK